jgi:transcriptional regulator with XRE-family HTH domain
MFSEIGSKIKKLRAEKNLTLKELNQLTNLSVGFLSQLERGLTTVAIDSLDNISKALGVDINYFFTMTREQTNVVQKSYEREVVLMDKDNFIQFYLSHNLGDKAMLPRLVEVYPKKDDETVLTYTHEGEEFIYILEGILTYYYNGERYELYPNDSVHIHSTASHNWENNTNKIVKLLMVSTPNRFQDHPEGV